MTEISTSIPADLLQKLREAGQEHLVQFWGELSEGQRQELLDDLNGLDLERFQTLLAQRDASAGSSPDNRAAKAQAPAQLVRQPQGEADRAAWAAASERGRALLRAGKVAAILVAGGQGTRLGFNQPKGMFPVGPLSGKTLYQWFAEQLLCRQREEGTTIPYFIMTSDATHAETEQYLKDNNYFGLNPANVFLFRQGVLPSVEAGSTRILLDQKHRISLSPDGHGGLLQALRNQGLLNEMERRGIEYLYYHQVDNPTALVCDPAFIGWHVAEESELSTKVVRKVSPDERMGVVCTVDGSTQIIEYSDLTADEARKTDAAGEYIFWAGNTAMHVFSRSFLSRLVMEQVDLPYHIARKAVPFVNEQGERVTPASPNATKFEQFIFDALPLATRALVVEADRQAEFNPVKNKEGNDSPATTRAALIANHRAWAMAAEASVNDGVVIEISPLAACDAEGAQKLFKAGVVLDRDQVIDGPVQSA